MAAIDKLRGKRKAFVLEYLIDLNAAAAYMRAGYKGDPAQAANNAARLIGFECIQAAIQEQMALRAQRCEIEADRVLKELALLAFSDIGEILDFTGNQVRQRPASGIPERARRTLASMKTKRHVEGTGDDAAEVEIVEFKMIDKLGALELAGRHLGLFTQRHEHSGPAGAAIPVEIIGIEVITS